MYKKTYFLWQVIIFVILVLLISFCDCYVNDSAKRKLKKTINSITDDNSIAVNINNTSRDKGRGFLHDGLFSFVRVVNFFPVGGENECQPHGTIAKAGICLNAYDCRQRDGRAAGDCYHGIGVCCVFEVTCGGAVQNNLTYFVSPGFPELWSGEEDCNITIDKTYAGIMQLRIDFIHFHIGQPNRTTGECDEDAMVLGDGETKFTLCGQNHAQHIYYTFSSGSVKREADDLPGSKTTHLSMRMRGGEMPRLWLMRLAQLPLAQSAPHGCLQYHTSRNGTIKTFNYATNGRHLADQEYKACIRRETGFCSVRYTQCGERSFRIGPNGDVPAVIDPAELDLGPGSSGGPGTGFYGPDGSLIPGNVSNTTVTALDQTTIAPQNVSQQEEMMPADDVETMEDEIEGSGMDPQIKEPTTSRPGILARIWGYICSMWGQRSARAWTRWSPYAQHYGVNSERYFGYGNFGAGLLGFGRQRCQDRITIPCENEYFVSGQYSMGGVCDPHHCGNTFCPQADEPCRVETSVTPFAVSVHFGPPSMKRNPEENIGVCLRYTQLPCNT